MKSRRIQIAKFALRWGIALIGIWWVCAQLTIHDRVNLVTESLAVESVVLLEHAEELSTTFRIEDPSTGASREVTRDQLVSRPDRATITLADGRDRSLLGVQLIGDINRNPTVTRLLIAGDEGAPGRWITPAEVEGGFVLRTPRPVVEAGLGWMVSQADPWMLAASIAVFPITYLATSLRWRRLLCALEINIPLLRVISLNMVGAFYNSFMPGSTGGDVLKAYYASKQTTHKTRAAVSVFVDRAIGLLALVMMGGSLAGVQGWMGDDPNSPTAVACRQIAAMSGLIVAGFGVGILIMGWPALRRGIGLSYVINRLPMQHHILKVREVATIYKRKPVLMLWALLVTFPVHVTVVISAIFAGKAFGLPISTEYYFVIVPVIVLVGSIPISPQGAGVMEFFAVLLTARQGATVSEAIALSMSVRVVQVLWNLAGGLFVLKGGYSTPPADPEAELERQAEVEEQLEHQTRGA
jgi:uncharacterized membrane protein YbhN (UPF0104 family)